MGTILLTVRFMFLRRSHVRHARQRPNVLISKDQNKTIQHGRRSRLVLLRGKTSVVTLVVEYYVLLAQRRPSLRRVRLLFATVVRLTVRGPHAYARRLSVTQDGRFTIPSAITIARVSFRQGESSFRVLV